MHHRISGHNRDSHRTGGRDVPLRRGQLRIFSVSPVGLLLPDFFLSVPAFERIFFGLYRVLVAKLIDLDLQALFVLL